MCVHGIEDVGGLEARVPAQFPNSGLPVANRFAFTTRRVLGRPPDRFWDDCVARLVGLLEPLLAVSAGAARVKLRDITDITQQSVY